MPRRAKYSDSTPFPSDVPSPGGQLVELIPGWSNYRAPESARAERECKAPDCDVVFKPRMIYLRVQAFCSQRCSRNHSNFNGKRRNAEST